MRNRIQSMRRRDVEQQLAESYGQGGGKKWPAGLIIFLMLGLIIAVIGIAMSFIEPHPSLSIFSTTPEVHEVSSCHLYAHSQSPASLAGVLYNKDGKTVMEFPLTIGVVGAVFLPVLAAVGAIAALIRECTISVTRSKNNP